MIYLPWFLRVREKKYFSRSGKSQGILRTSHGEIILQEKSGNFRKDKIISGIQEKFANLGYGNLLECGYFGNFMLYINCINLYT